jgi:hypothetical protein
MGFFLGYEALLPHLLSYNHHQTAGGCAINTSATLLVSCGISSPNYDQGAPYLSTQHASQHSSGSNRLERPTTNTYSTHETFNDEIIDQ